MNKQCIILAGGLGTRLKGILPNIPKCLAPVNGRPFLELQLEYLKNQGVDQFILSLGYKSEMVKHVIESSLSKRFNIEIVVEPYQLKTGGAILHVMKTIGSEESLVMNGDTILTGNMLPMFYDLDIKNGELVRIASIQVDDKSRYGTIVTNSQSRITGFLEKDMGDKGLINAGLYRISKEIFKNIQIEAFSLEEDIFPHYIQSKNVYSYSMKGRFIDIGIPEDYVYLNANINKFIM